MVLPDGLQADIRDIREDNTSGAAELAARAAKVLRSTGDQAVETPGELHDLLIDTARTLIAAQPAMASLFTLANEVLLAVDAEESIEGMRRELRATCDRFTNRLEQSADAIAAGTHTLLGNSSTVLTYSYSSTVLHALEHTHDAGTDFHVICAESRPILEGVTLAERLGERGITVRLVIDAAIFSFLPDADLVLVGADSVALQGVTNKIGTAALATIAHDAGLPVYVLCSTAKFLPAGVKPHPPEQKPAGEILTPAPPNVTPVNYYFDLTPAPLDLFAGIVTERGLMDPTATRAALQQQPLHPALREDRVQR